MKAQELAEFLLQNPNREVKLKFAIKKNGKWKNYLIDTYGVECNFDDNSTHIEGVFKEEQINEPINT